LKLDTFSSFACLFLPLGDFFWSMAILCFYDLSLPWKKFKLKNFANKFTMLPTWQYYFGNSFFLNMELEILKNISPLIEINIILHFCLF
jgi:hypothetical protein